MELAAGCVMCENDASHLVVEANHEQAHAACEDCAQELVSQEEGREHLAMEDVDLQEPVQGALH